MWQRRFIYSALLFLGTILAVAGWFAEWRDLPIDLLYVTIVGHVLQVVGAFGHLMMPERLDENETNFSDDNRRLFGQ